MPRIWFSRVRFRARQCRPPSCWVYLLANHRATSPAVWRRVALWWHPLGCLGTHGYVPKRWWATFSGYGCLVTDDVVPKRPRFLTISQVAEELSVGAPTVRQLIKTGELRALQIGGRGIWRIGAQDLEDYIEKTYRVTADRVARGEVSAEVDTQG